MALGRGNIPLLELSREQVDVWLVYVDDTYDDNLIYAYHNMLAEQELLQESRFYFPKDQHRFLLTRALVRDVLSRYVTISPKDWRFEQNEFGRPSIANDDVNAKQISFNISHADGLIILGVVKDRAVGVDTERLTRIAPVQNANRYFYNSETQALQRLQPSLQQQRFFEL